MALALSLLFAFLGVLFFLLISAALLYRRLLGRWLQFSLAFGFAYSLGSYALFGRLPAFILQFVETPEQLKTLCVVLFFIGPVIVTGACLFRQLAAFQILGAVASYFAVCIGTLVLSGLMQEEAVEAFLLQLPYILFFVGTPLVLGWALAVDMPCGSVVGWLMAWCSGLVLLVVATTNYFGRPFGFQYELSIVSRLWIELAVVAVSVFGIPGVVGYGLMHDWQWRTIRGALTLFVLGMAAVGILVGLTSGYPILSQLFSGRNQ